MTNRKRKKIVLTLVDIIIPVYNRFDILADCLKAIPDAFGNIEYNIILIDNNSETKTAVEFYSQFSTDTKISVIKNSHNLGFPKACNQGYRRGSSPLVFFLNSDVIMEPGSGERLVKTMDNPDIGICGMKLLFPTHEETMSAGLDINGRPPRTIQHVGLHINIRGEILHTFIGWPDTNKRVNKVREVLAVTGAAMMTRRVLYREVGGFDEAYGMGTFEDVDFCLKIQNLNKLVIVEQEAVGTHYVGATAEKYKQPFPLGTNYRIFVGKWKDKLTQTDFLVL